LPVRHWIVPGHTVDVTTVAQVKRELADWRLGRCVFVGDAGRVSKANRKALTRGGEHYIACMPIPRGGEVDQSAAASPARSGLAPVALTLQEIRHLLIQLGRIFQSTIDALRVIAQSR
jgi:hypothetical protein